MEHIDDKTLESLVNHSKWLKRVLVVDDDKKTLDAFKTTLEDAGLEIHTAEDGESAIKKINEQEFAVIICDRELPVINGLEVLKEAMKIQPDMSRVVLTAAANLSLAAVVSSVEKYNLIKENRRLNETLQNELAIGSQIQKLLLAGDFPKDIPGVDIEVLTLPSKHIDGDFYGFYRPSSHLLDVVIGDVMGKGLSAALVGLAAKTQFTRFAHPLDAQLAYNKTKGWHTDILEPNEILKKVNHEIYDPLKKLEQFVSLFYCRFNFKEQTLSYIDCGLSKPIHFRASKNAALYIEGNNFPLGIGAFDEDYYVKEIDFRKGDIFVLHSDGITKARSPKGELFGLKRLLKIVNAHSEKKIADLTELIKDEVSLFTENEEFEDDLTIIIIKMLTSTPLEHKPKENIAKFNSHLSQLKAVRQFVERFCIQVSEKTSSIIHLMQLAIDEIFCNIVNHSYKGVSGNEIIIQANFNEDGLIFEVLDQGEPFDPTEVEHPSLAGDKEGGFGFYLVKEIADELSYKRKKAGKGWNCLRITKKINIEGEVMEISNYQKGNILVVTLEGKNLDAKETPDFKRKIIELIEKEKASHVVLNLSNLNFIDSTGLGSFLSLLRTLNGETGDLKLSNMSQSIRTIFELVCMHKIFEIYNTVDEAVAAFNHKTSQMK